MRGCDALRISTRTGAVFLVFLTMLCATSPARTEDPYVVSGQDTFQIGNAPSSLISYNGTEQLQEMKQGKSLRFLVEAHYIRSESGRKAPVRAYFVQDQLPDGTLEDKQNSDPDSLTILNQPFSIKLDLSTLHDLQKLRGSVPFEASSPITGGTLHGTLRGDGTGIVAGIPAIGVRFEADGPMRGPLPGHPQIAINGTMRMDGTAYYASSSAILVALQARLTIAGTLDQNSLATPVHILYTRVIKRR